VALIASAGVSILIIAVWGERGITAKPTDINLSAVGIFLISLIVLKKWKPDPLFVMFGSGIAGLILYFWIGVS
jgi:chromate transporter